MAAAIVSFLMLASLAPAQKLEIKLDHLAAQATTKNEIDLDGPLLKMALSKATEFAKAKDGKKDDKDGKGAKRAAMTDLLASIDSVHVRHYEFDKPGVYGGELDPLRQQVGSGSGWSRIVGVQEKNQSTEIFLWMQGEQVGGCLVLVAEPKEVTVVHVGGAISLAQMKELVNSDIKYDLSSLLANMK